MKVQEIKILNIENVPHVVEEMSKDIQNMVAQYNEWRQHLEDHRSEMAKAELALEALSNRIMVAIKQEKEAAETKKVEDAANDATAPAAE